MRKAFVLFWFVLAAQSQAQTQSPDSSMMQALLSEVHQLRIAIERSNIIGPRIQLFVERIKIQQEQVSGIRAKLEGVKHDLARVQSDETRLSEQIKNSESDLTQATDPLERKNLNNILRELKPHLDQMQKQEQGLHSQDADLSSSLNSAQAALDGLNDRLSQIERALDTTPIQ